MDKRITMLVIDADEKYARELADYAEGREEFLSVEYTCSGREGYELMKLISPDIVIMDFFIPHLDGIGFLRRMIDEDGMKHPKIIINSGAMLSSMIGKASEYGVDYFMMKPQSIIEVCNTVVDVIKNNDDIKTIKANEVQTENIDITITRFLHCMGVPAHLHGYSYIRSSLKLAIEDMEILMPITRNLYPQLARQYNTSASAIERAIRHAIKVSWERGNKKVINDVFGYTSDNSYMGCPTNSEYIAMAADDLRLRIKHGMVI